MLRGKVVSKAKFLSSLRDGMGTRKRGWEHTERALRTMEQSTLVGKHRVNACASHFFPSSLQCRSILRLFVQISVEHTHHVFYRSDATTPVRALVQVTAMH